MKKIIKKELFKTNKEIVKHLHNSRDLGKEVLQVVPEIGSAIISHSFRIETKINEKTIIISEINFLPLMRLYNKQGSVIIGDESLLNEDVEQ